MRGRAVAAGRRRDAMRVQLFSRSGAVVATVEVGSHAEAILLDGKLYILRNGVFREAILADYVEVLDQPK